MFRKQQGLSLVYVLVLVTTLSVVLSQQLSEQKIKNDRLALEYTLMLSESVQNAAYAFYVNSAGEWPHVTPADDCEFPDGFVPFAGLFNGWGYELSPANNCDKDDNTFDFEQKMPSRYANYFISRTDSAVVEDDSNEVATVRVSVGVTGGMKQFFEARQVKKFGGGNYFEASTPECDGGQPPAFIVGFDSLCLKDETYHSYHHNDDPNAPHDEIYAGYRLFTHDSSFSTDQDRVKAYPYSRHLDHSATPDPWEGLSKRANNSHKLDYLDLDCQVEPGWPGDSIDTRAVVMSWCE